MRSALYFPHTSVHNVEIAKTALLLWDRLEYIVPWQGFRAPHGSPGIQRAMELIGAPCTPNNDEKEEAHRRLVDLTDSSLPSQFYLNRHRDEDPDYEMYANKLLPQSWDVLRHARMSRGARRDPEYTLRAAAGLTVMSILADCCAGTTRSRVTDRGEAYAAVAGLLGNDPSGSKIPRPNAHAQLVSISLEVIDTSQLPLAALIRLREREERESGRSLRDLRHRYLDGLENYVAALVTEKSTRRDAEHVKMQFADDMRQDLEDLRAELGFAGREALLSKELLVASFATFGTVASWLFGAPLNLRDVVTSAGAPVAIGGLLGAANRYFKERKTILRRHPMAYLYETQPQLRRRR